MPNFLVVEDDIFARDIVVECLKGLFNGIVRITANVERGIEHIGLIKNM